MKIFLDTANVNEIKEAAKLGFLDGVTTNPSLIAKEKRKFDDAIKINVTLCFSATQAMFAAKAGAYFISPFIGRIDDTGHDGMVLIRDIVQIYKNYNYK